VLRLKELWTGRKRAWDAAGAKAARERVRGDPTPGVSGSCEVNDRGGRVCGLPCVRDVYWVWKKREVIGLLRDRVKFGDGAAWGS